MLVIIIVILNIIKVITQEELENHKYNKKINTYFSKEYDGQLFKALKMRKNVIKRKFEFLLII